MRKRQGAVLDTARHVEQFLGDNATVIGPVADSSHRNLNDAITELTTMARTQSSGQIASQGATARTRSLLVALRVNHMRPIAEVGRQQLREVPEFTALKMPTEALRATQLVAAAQAMADAAALHHAVFTNIGLPDNFLARLHAAADAVTASLDSRQHAMGSATSATAGLLAQEKRVRSLFKLLNALVVPELGSDPVLLRKWKSTKAIGSSTAQASPQAPVPPAQDTSEPDHGA